RLAAAAPARLAAAAPARLAVAAPARLAAIAPERATAAFTGPRRPGRRALAVTAPGLRPASLALPAHTANSQ
ncbi:RDD family protein, partial [Streptomyces hyaluromycini]